MAPKFNIASKPNDWTKTIGSATNRMQTENLSDTKKLQLEYWTHFREFVSQNSQVLRSQKPLPQHWTNFAIGRSHFHIAALVNTWENKIGVVLSLGGPETKPHYYLLESDRENIENEYGAELEWRENPDKKESGIWLRRDMNPADKTSWPEQHRWLLEQLEKFNQVFAPRIKVLDAEQYTPEEVPDS